MKRITKDTIELLAPVGNWECLRAAVANGADAIYFGVDKYNARVRAKNFQVEELREIMAYLHKYNVRGYVTLNILLFETELEEARQLILACIDSGVDALIVQDLGLLKLIREISPYFPIHGSTQMTVTSAEAAQFLEPFQLEVVVLGRENNLKQIKTISNAVNIPIEVFVHGAICVSYSGQCLTSEMWGGRSANRGECAQACRLPYDLIVDGERKEMGNIAYVLSPKDLAAIELVPQLIEAGVSSLKIEGRMKSPEYVANVVSKYRKAIDEYIAGKNYTPTKNDMRELQQSFSRGFTYGFLQGTDHKQLVDGSFPKSRGVRLGTVKRILNDAVLCEVQAPIKRGDGIVFDAGRPDLKEEGGRVYDLRKKGKKIKGEVKEGLVEIVLGRHDVNVTKIRVGHTIWKTSDAELERQLQKTFETEMAYQLFPITVTVTGKVGKPLETKWTDEVTGHTVVVESDQVLEKAIKRPLSEMFLREQLGRLGGTIFELMEVKLHTNGEVILPMKELNRMRRTAVELLLSKRMEPVKYEKLDYAIVNDGKKQTERAKENVQLISLCRTMEQVEAACQTDANMIYADFEFTKNYQDAVKLARNYGKPIALATPRIFMPGEQGVLNGILRTQPDAILVRNLGSLQYYLQHEIKIPLIGDFSLNVANHLAYDVLFERGLSRITPSYDLNIQQMVDLLKVAPASQSEVVIHQHLPMYHMEHCVYCTFLSEGTDYTNCGRPCEEHRISLQDRVGFSHPVRVDVGCRNTVFNAIEQSGAEYIQTFKELGVHHFRVEFLEEDGQKVKEVLLLYRQALQGERTGTSVWKKLKATNQLGVTRGQLVK